MIHARARCESYFPGYLAQGAGQNTPFWCDLQRVEVNRNDYVVQGRGNRPPHHPAGGGPSHV